MYKRLKKHFADNAVAFAAAWNEVKTARAYPEYLRGIYDAHETLLSWSIRRGELWA